MSGEKSKADKIDRRTILKNTAVAAGGLTAASGTASAGKPNSYANAGWGLVDKEKCGMLRRKKPKSFKVLGRNKFGNYPAGCSPNSQKKKYTCYRVKFKYKKNGRYKYFTANLYRRKNMKQFEKNAHYNIKNVKSCGKHCRVHFKAKR